MKEKEKEKDKNKYPQIDKEADVRAGGYHNTYSHEFEEWQKNEKKSVKTDSNQQLSTNLKNKQNEELIKPVNSSIQQNDAKPTNKNYGWQKGFDRSESYGSELKNNPEVQPDTHNKKNQDL